MSGEVVCFYCKKTCDGSLCDSCRGFMKKRKDLELQVETMGLSVTAVQNGMTPDAVLEVLNRSAKGAPESS